MNESFFGQYSVFCVFGSVVGCVVVPLIAQVLQQQSMECMILSAIVLSLTAAHLNKKGGNEKDCSKVLFAKDFERKRVNHNNNNTKTKKHHTHTNHSLNTSHNSNTHHIQEHDQEFMQQHEHLRVVEMERRTKEKRLKKLRKREEKLKKREEENKKQKELEERYRLLKEKRLKQKENLYGNTRNTYYNTSLVSFEKYCSNESTDKRQRHGLSTVDENKPRRNNSYMTHSQRIPRFERSRTSSLENSSQCYSSRPVTGNLSIGCPSLSTSCSSLSSISSSGSSSPPLPASPPPCPWKLPYGIQENKNSKPNNQKSSWNIVSGLSERGKSYSNGRQVKDKLFGLSSSSLFCGQPNGNSIQKRSNETVASYSGEYSLFGPPKLGNNIIKSTVK